MRTAPSARTDRSVQRPRSAAAVLAVAAALLTISVVAPLALAHGDEGDMELTRLEQVGPDRIEIEVGIVYANDGHLAESATVTAQLTHDDGTAVGPVDLAHRGPGTAVYTAAVDLPAAGSWSVAVTSTGPDAAASGTLVVDETPPTTEAPATTAAPPATEAPPATDADDTSVVAPPPDELAAAVDDGEGGGLLLAALVVIVVVAAIGSGVFWWSRRGRAAEGPPASDA